MATRKAAATPARKPTKPAPPRAELPIIDVVKKNPGKKAAMALTGLEPAAKEPRTIEVIELGLRPTATPGVYINELGVLVDGDGVMLEMSAVRKRDKEHRSEVAGETVDTPAKFLKSVALDASLPLNTRMEAAKSAAPYFDTKKPVGVNISQEGKISVEVIHKLAGMPQAELDKLEDLLKRGAVALVEGPDGVFEPEEEEDEGE